MYEEIKLEATESLTLQLVAGNFSEGTYTITAEMIDPEAENVLEARSLTIKVAEAPTVLPLIPVILTTTIIAIIGVAVYAWYRLKKPNNARARAPRLTSIMNSVFLLKVSTKRLIKSYDISV